MKANQKFVNADDEAVSPVIAVILMVAITVVLAATVYVWVSGFGASTSSAQKSIALSSAGALSGAGAGSTTGNKTYTVASSTSGMKWSDITVTVNGVTQSLDVGNATTCASAVPLGVAGASYAACTGGNYVTSTASVIHAGDTITVSANSGNTLRILDA